MLKFIYNMVFSSITIFLIGIAVSVLLRRSVRHIGYGFRKILWMLLTIYLFIPIRIDTISRNVNDAISQLNHTKTVQNIQQYDVGDNTGSITQNSEKIDTEYPSLANENELAKLQEDFGDRKKESEIEQIHTETTNDRTEASIIKFIIKNKIYLLFIWITGSVLFASMKSDKKEEIIFWIDDDKETVDDKEILACIDTLRQEMKIKSYVSIYYSEMITSPCITGICNPVIYIPKKMQNRNEDFENIIKHELNHYKSGDIIYKLFFEIASVLLWFNPVIYFIKNRAYEDMEFVCDAKVTKNMNVDEIRNYCNSIINIVPMKDNVFLSFRNPKEKLLDRIDNCFDSRRYESGKKETVFLMIVMTIIMVGGNSVIYGFADEEKIVQSEKMTDKKVTDKKMEDKKVTDKKVEESNSSENDTTIIVDKNNEEEKDDGAGHEVKVKSGIDKTSDSVPITEKPVHYDTGLKISKESSIVIRDDFLQELDEEEKAFVKEEIFFLHSLFEYDLVRCNVKEKRGGESSVWLEYYDDPDDNVVPTYPAEVLIADFDKIIDTVKNDECKGYLTEIKNDFQNAFDNRNLAMLYMVHQKLHDLSYFAVNYPLGTLENPPADWYGIHVYFGTLERFCR